MKNWILPTLLFGGAITLRAQTGPGTALQIAGTVNYVAVPHTTSFNSLPITVMAWVNTTVTTGQQGLVNQYVANSFSGWNLFLLNGRVRAWYFVSSTRNVFGGGDGLDGGFIADGRWHHVALVVDSSGGSLYVDGIEQQSRLWTGAFGATTTTQEVRIGSYPNGNDGFAGSIFIDDVSVWNASLSFSQIQTSRNGGVTGLEGSRLAFYRCDEGGGNTVADSAPLGGNNNGTWVGLSLFSEVMPSVQSLPAQAVGIAQATLSGMANPNRSVLAAGFQWGPTTNFGSTAVAATLGSAAATTNLFYSLSVTGLTFDTTYHFRAFASNSAGMAFGTAQTFRTLNLVETRPASSLRLTAARLNGAVTTLDSALTAWFEWGQTTNYGNVTSRVSVPANSTNLPLSADIAGAFQGQTIHFRLVATNASVRANGANLSLAIPAYPGSVGVPPLRSTSYGPGSGGWVEFEPRAEWDRAVPMTVEAWVYRQDTNRIETVLSHDFPGSYWLGFSPRLRFHRGTNFAEVPRIVPALKWTHVAVSYDGVGARFYINGEFVGVRSLSHTGAGRLRPLRVGHNITGPTNDASIATAFVGNLDEIRLWSVARSESEIRNGLYREVRGEPGLAAVFPRGGHIEEISGLIGSGGPTTEQVFGMMPRDLIVPRSPVSPVADGSINLATEYAGADLLVQRYPDFPTVPDGVASFVRTDNDLFVALTVNGRLGISPSGFVGLFVDTTNGRPALAEFPQVEVLAQLDADTNHTALLNGDGLGGYFACFTPTNPGPPQPCTPRSLWQATPRVCGGEIAPDACIEFRVSRTLLGSFNEFDGVALGLFNVTGSGDQSFTPEDSLPNSPANWVMMSYGEGSALLPRVKWNGRVSANPTNKAPPLTNHPVSLFANDIAHTTRTDTNGQFSFDVPMPVGQSIRGQPGIVSFALQGRPSVCTNCLPDDVEPMSVFTNGVLYPALPPGTTGIVQLAVADFFLQPPPGVAAITGASPANPQCGMAVRQGEAGGLGERVTLFGTNLHGSMEFYLVPVSATFPNSPAAWTLLPAEVKSRAANGTSVVVEAPFVPEFVRRETNGPFVPSFSPLTLWRWVAHDSHFRPGRIEFSIVGDFSIRPPPYPIVHGFNFVNRDSDATMDEFLAGYGFNAYFCVDPIGDCDAHALNPLYPYLWYPVHRAIINKSGGSCVGFSGTALELFNHLLTAQSFDADALLANGLRGDGFPGHYDKSNSGGVFTRPPIPTDIWGQIRQNHGAQTSAEYLLHALSQLESDSLFFGDPVARLRDLRAGTTAQALCMARGFDGGHCVTPYLVEDNFGGNPDKTRVWIYDNEAPCATNSAANARCVTNQFIDIDHVTNTFRFKSNEGRLLFTVPGHLYTGKRTAPGLTDIAQLLGSLVLVVAGGADAHLTAPGAREWGWRPDETFVDNLPGLRAVPIFGSSTNRTRGIPLLLPLTNGLPVIDVQARDTNAHIFHVAQGGTMLQLESAAGQPGRSSRFTLGLRTNQIASFRFTPQGTQGSFIPRAGFVIHTNASATFQWMGLAAEDGRTQEFRALKERRAVEYRNETTRPTTHHLRIDAVDGATANNACAVFGPFTVPTGAVHCVVLHDWPRARTVRSELDLNADGIPDQITTVTGVEIDGDGDGLPDAWEIMRQLNPEDATCDDGAEGDPDRDGISNLGEYLTDTNPRDAASALRLTARVLAGNTVRLSWNAVPGRRYEILYADDLWHIFRPLPNAGFPRVATSTMEHFDDTFPATAQSSRFYQLRLVP